ncbi:MAG: HupE/UreJ family protein [Limnohabitans sp.]|nr:HupE/UreJ family protein [Limnohabitans sp.]
MVPMKTLGGSLARVWSRALALFLLIFTLQTQAHEIPDDVKLTSLIRAEGTQLVVLIRAPLAAMREADIPLRGNYLDLPRADAALQVAARLWMVDRLQVQANGLPLPPAQLTHVRVSLSSDRSFDTFERAQAQLMTGSPLRDSDLVWTQQYLDARLIFTMPTADARVAIDFDAARLGTRVTNSLRYKTPSGQERWLQLHGQTGMVELDPGPWSSIQRFAQDGLHHILSGLDHLLFVLCLMLGMQRLRHLVWTVTGFTLAHSITLALAVTDLTPTGLWFMPTVEWAIAASIVLAAIDVMLVPERPSRWWMASAFGLIHGLGFSFALRESLPFAGEHIGLALVSFNLGVEAGQLGVLLLLWPVLQGLRQRPRASMAHLVVCALITHTAWHWMSERWEAVEKFLQTLTINEVMAATLAAPWLWGLLAGVAAWRVVVSWQASSR